MQVNKFDVITSFAMFYDVENPNKFCKDIFNLLNKKNLDARTFIHASYVKKPYL